MTTIRILPILGLFLCAAQLAIAQETNHYLNGTSGIRAGTLPPQGRYWLHYNFLYRADRTTDPAGDPQDLDLYIHANAHRFVFVTDYQILGADFAWNFVTPFVHSSVEIPGVVGDSSFSFGDLNVEPFIMQWREDRYDFGFVYGFLAPTGRRDPIRPSFPGKNYWTHYAGLAGTYYFDQERTWTASILSRYEVHTKRRDVDLTAGDHFSFEWGVAKNFNQALDVGVSGYAVWKVNQDRGADAVPFDSRDRAAGLGPEIQYFSQEHNLGLHVRHWWEFGARNRPEGQITNFTIVMPY